MRRIEAIRSANRANKAVLRGRVADLPGLSFRRVPDPEGDSGTFLSLLLPDQDAAEQAVESLRAANVPGINYWYTNMYHFINQWDHVKNLDSAAPLAIHALGAPQDYLALELPRSQSVVGRLISVGIGCAWEPDRTERIGDDLRAALARVLS
jgi:8-amino-3,8-dideoxy-alpha-D-manno-octulosonate transaminase